MISRKCKILLTTASVGICLVLFHPVAAQYFSSEPESSRASSYSNRSSSTSTKSSTSRRYQQNNLSTATTKSQNQNNSSAVQSSLSNPNLRRNYLSDNKEIIGSSYTNAQSRLNQVLSPTADGSQRGTVSMGQIVRKNNGKLMAAATSSIFLYYDNFSVRRGLMGDVSCDVRFYVITTLDRKLSTLSVKLKWPKMETALNFMDVAPNVDTYFDYTLVGEGCYSMDKVPNIIVNRCRVAKMSQEECAAKIKWIKKGL